MTFDAKTTAAEILDGVDLTGRTAIVTGGASGLGAATARALTGAGARVAATTRRDLDLGDLDSVRTFTRHWEGPIDMLVANAGVMAVPERRLTAEGWELQLATNFLGHFALITGLERHFTDRTRVVVVSSGVQVNAPFDFDDPQFERRPYDPWVAYGQSKVADVLLAVGVTRRGTPANALNPGYIHTRLQRHLDPATMRALGAMDDDGNRLTSSYYKSPEQGASTSVLLAAFPAGRGCRRALLRGQPGAPGRARWPGTARRGVVVGRPGGGRPALGARRARGVVIPARPTSRQDRSPGAR